MIKIRNTWGQIGLNTTQAGIRMAIRDPMLKFKQTMPQVEIEMENARISLDSTDCWKEIGLKDIMSFTRGNAQKGYQACLSYTGEVSSRGDMMARPDKYELESILAQYAGKAFKQYDFNVTRIPRSPVDVSVIPAKTQIEWQKGRIKGDYLPGDVTVEDMGGRVEVYLRRKAGIDIRYEPQVDLYV